MALLTISLSGFEEVLHTQDPKTAIARKLMDHSEIWGTGERGNGKVVKMLRGMRRAVKLWTRSSKSSPCRFPGRWNVFIGWLGSTAQRHGEIWSISEVN